MESYKILGEGRRGSWPYEVGLRWANDDDGLPTARPLGLSEGTGHGNQGGTFALADLLDPIWTEHLKCAIVDGCAIWRARKRRAGRGFRRTRFGRVFRRERRRQNRSLPLYRLLSFGFTFCHAFSGKNLM